MSRKINLMVEVSDTIYATVVAPHKQNKTFSKLITTLIQGYSENMLIRGYVEDTLEGMRKASSAALEDLIGSMKEGLANMGMYAEELKSNAQEGVDTFSSAKEESKSSLSAEEIKDVVSEETKELRNMVDVLTNQNEKIMQMLVSMSANPQPVQTVSMVQMPQTQREQNVDNIILSESVTKTPCQEDTPPARTVSPVTEVKENMSSKHEGTEDWGFSEVPILQEVASDEESVDGNDVMASLLSGNQFKF